LDKETDLPGDNVIFCREQNTYLTTHHLLSLDIGTSVCFWTGSSGRRVREPTGVRRAYAEFGMVADENALTVFLPNQDPGYGAGEAVADAFLALPIGKGRPGWCC
jgi:hypothetical protein